MHMILVETSFEFVYIVDVRHLFKAVQEIWAGFLFGHLTLLNEIIIIFFK